MINTQQTPKRYNFVPPRSTDELTTAPIDGENVMCRETNPITAEQLDRLLANQPDYKDAIAEHGPLFRQFLLSHMDLQGNPSRLTPEILRYYYASSPNRANFHEHWHSCSRVLKNNFKRTYISYPDQCDSSLAESTCIANPSDVILNEQLLEMSIFNISPFLAGLAMCFFGFYRIVINNSIYFRTIVDQVYWKGLIVLHSLKKR